MLSKIIENKKMIIIFVAAIMMFLQFDKAVFDHQNISNYLIFQNASEELVINKMNYPKIRNNGYGLKYKYSTFRDNARIVNDTDEVSDDFYGYVCDNNVFVRKNYVKGNIIEFEGKKRLKIIDVEIKKKKAFISLEKSNLNIEDNLDNFNIYEKKTNKLIDRKNIIDYVSQVGIQGHIFSFLYNKCHFSRNMLYHINNLLLSIVLVIICILVYKRTNLIFSIVMYASFILSPWLTSFSRNLYWISFSWFLPVVFALLYFTDYKKRYLLLMFLSILFKCLAGYEYISTIFIFALSIPFAEIIKNKNQWKMIIKHLCIISIVMICGFLAAILMHATLRGNNLFEGVHNIFVQDVLRRTYGSSQSFDPFVLESLKASPIAVLNKYIYGFSTDILLGLPSNLFPILLIISGIYSVYKFIKEKYFYSFLYFVMLLAPLSWFILAKGHSYIHTHMNFVLWYFGFIGVMIYMLIVMLKDGWNYVISNKLD